MRFLKILTAMFLGAAAPAAACGPDTDCVLGDRTYRIALPEGHVGDRPLPAIVFAHGFRGSAQGVMRNGSLRRMVSDLGAALIAVKSKGDLWIIPNAPRHMDSDGAEEFAYFDSVLEDAARRFPIDRARVMVSGFSTGGMMVWNLACARSDRFAGFAPIAGTFWLKPPETCAGPVANVIHIHGDADKTVPLKGRPIGSTKQGEVSQALEMYGEYGGFGPMTYANRGDLRCEERRNPAGDLLDFCLFSGGHSFRTEFVRFAWQRLEEAGRL
jgi:polyhydroxybutyrate depolymerase